MRILGHLPMIREADIRRIKLNRPFVSVAFRVREPCKVRITCYCELECALLVNPTYLEVRQSSARLSDFGWVTSGTT